MPCTCVYVSHQFDADSLNCISFLFVSDSSATRESRFSLGSCSPILLPLNPNRSGTSICWSKNMTSSNRALVWDGTNYLLWVLRRPSSIVVRMDRYWAFGVDELMARTYQIYPQQNPSVGTKKAIQEIEGLRQSVCLSEEQYQSPCRSTNNVFRTIVYRLFTRKGGPPYIVASTKMHSGHSLHERSIDFMIAASQPIVEVWIRARKMTETGSLEVRDRCHASSCWKRQRVQLQREYFISPLVEVIYLPTIRLQSFPNKYSHSCQSIRDQVMHVL